MNLAIPRQAPTPLAIPRSSIPAPKLPEAKPFAATPESRAAALAKRQAQLAEWSALNKDPATRLRQVFADEDHMRACLRKASVRIGSDFEPATVTRLRSLLRRGGMQSPQITEAIGTSLEGFLKLNPKLPLWAATALVLEAHGAL